MCQQNRKFQISDRQSRREETSLGLTLICPDTGKNSKLFETDKYPPADGPDVYRIETPDRFMMLEKRNSNDYAAQVEMLSADLRLIRLDKKITNNETEHEIFTGLINTVSNADMIGFVLLAPDGNDAMYTLTYAGIGNYSDIRIEALNIMRSFLNRLQAGF